MTKTQNADSDFVATDVSTAGALSYWRLSGETTVDKLTAAWLAAGLNEDLLPKPVSGRVAVTRAVDALSVKIDANTHREVKQARGWWGIVDATNDGHGNFTHNQLGRACYDSKNQKVVVKDAPFTIEQQIRDNVALARTKLLPGDITSWLVKLAEHCNAVSLRDKGGIYFIPRTQVDFWANVADAVAVAGDFKIFRIPALKTDEAIEAIVDAITQEAEQVGKVLLADLTKEGDDAIGERALRSKTKNAEVLLGKIRSYEDLFDVKLDEQVAKIQAVAAKVAEVAKARREGLANAGETVGASAALGGLVVGPATTNA